MHALKRLAALAGILLILQSPLAGQRRPAILTVQHVIRLMESSLTKVQDYTASFQLVNGTYTASGTIFYMKPFFLRVNSMTDGVQLVTNGKLLWIYIPAYGLVAEQDLIKSEDSFKIALAATEKNLRHMQQEYSFSFAPGGRDNAAQFILDLKPRVTKIGFKEIRLWVDRESGLITRVASKTVNGKTVDITFTGIKTNLNPALTKGLFYFGMPDANVQTIRNTILPAELVDKRR